VWSCGQKTPSTIKPALVNVPSHTAASVAKVPPAAAFLHWLVPPVPLSQVIDMSDPMKLGVLGALRITADGELRCDYGEFIQAGHTPHNIKEISHYNCETLK